MNTNRAMEWGKWLAAFLLSRKEGNPFLLAAKFGWQIIFENEDDSSVLMPAYLAEWDGSRRSIRLFVANLRRYLGNSATVLHRACAHELFHGLAAVDYRALRSAGLLSAPALLIPKLNYREEEIAARVFSEALLNSSLLEEESCPPLVSR
jgi:hypothetical protein